MPKGKGRLFRCATCGLHEELCLCADLDPIDVPGTRLVVVQHHLESQKPTSTGPLTRALWRDSELIVFGRLDEPLDEAPLADAQTDYVVLFPLADAAAITEEELSPRPGRRRAFVLLDATWRQASRMARRVPWVRHMTFRSLPVARPSAWPVRRSRLPHQLCTLEAAIALAHLAGGPAERLREIFALHVARMQQMRGE
jgi:hypothetical protein